MLSNLFINLFNIEKQSDWYWYKAAMLIKTKTDLKHEKHAKQKQQRKKV